jgi:hypothetical protein
MMNPTRMNASARAQSFTTIAASIGAGMLLLITAMLLSGFTPLWGVWIEQRSADIWTLDPAVKVTLLQTALAVVGGVWAFYLYTSSRASQTTISITATCWLAKTPVDGFRALNVRIRVTNASKAICRNCEATVALMDATERDRASGQLLMPIFAEQDPWWNLYPDPGTDYAISLEPGESIDSETPFLLRRRPLLGVRISVEGDQGLFRSPFEWGSFFLVDAAALEPVAFAAPTQ